MKQFIVATLFAAVALYADEPILHTDFIDEACASIAPVTQLTPQQYIETTDPVLDMTWNDPGSGGKFHWFRNRHGTLLEISYDDKPPRAIRDRFEKKGKGYSYVILDTVKGNYDPTPDDYQYLITTPRRFDEKSSCDKISSADLVDLVQNGSPIFYTGSGISAAADVPTMHLLREMLFLENGVDFEDWIVEIAEKSPQVLEAKIGQFFKSCFNSPPTSAHRALKQIVVQYEAPLMTENLDHLHERSGIVPNRIYPTALNTEASIERLKKTDLIICLGLSHDDRGFLAWYKEVNPNGKIVSVDLVQPNYLADDDLFLEGDVQEVLPQVFTQLCQ